MDVARAFTYITEDERWVGKIVIGAVISFFTFLLLPIPLLAGWMVGITRNVMAGVERPLPEWDDFGTLFRDGLAVVVAPYLLAVLGHLYGQTAAKMSDATVAKPV